MMTKNVAVDGVKYVPEMVEGPIKIVVLDDGFVYVGCYEKGEKWVTIWGARCLIYWGTDKHLGQLVNGPLEKTRLGDPCTVRITIGKISHLIEVEQDAWK